MRLPTILLMSAAVLPSSVLAAPLLQMDVAPFIGGGTTSGAQVTDVSGAGLTVGHDFSLGGELRLTPQVEFIDSFIGTKAQRDGTTTLGTYDTRVFAFGFKLSDSLGTFGRPGQRVYAAAMGGTSFSKLSLDSNAKDQSTIASYDQIIGSYASFEAGTFLPFKDRFGLTLAGVTGFYQQDQRQAAGQFEQDRLNGGGQLSLASGDQASRAGGLPDRVYLRTFALKVGLSLAF